MEEVKRCRICLSTNIKPFLDLGKQPLANTFLKKTDLNKKEEKYPLKVLFCETCNLCQLSHVVSPTKLFRNYIYYSSPMPQLPLHFKNYAEDVINRFITTKNSFIVEIGSNDGLFLKTFKDRGFKILGVDPALNIAAMANQKGIQTIPEFFNKNLAQKIKKRFRKANIIVANNVFAHINDHHDLVSGIKNLLAKNGVFILEAPYIIDMFENLTFDTIYHEHLSYLSVKPLKRLFSLFDMEVFDVQIYPVQGQSIRVFVGHKNQHRILPSVKEFLKKEKAFGLNSYSSYKRLARKIESSKRETIKLLKKLKSQNFSIAGYGAPAKGNTLLNYYHIGPEILDYITEALPSKIGKFTPGTHIPVIDIKKARRNPPDYYFLLVWNYKEAILKNEKKFLDQGGKFILPTGKPSIIGQNQMKKTKQKNKILVTGGFGYIGSVLCSKLAKLGYKTKIVDLGIFPNNYVQNLPNTEIIKCDIRNILPSLFSDVKSVIHLAGFSTDPTSQYNPRLTDTVNHLATERLAQIAKQKGAKRFIYASTASVYFSFQTPPEPPLYKETDRINPISVYSITKRCSEQILLSMSDIKFRPTILRKGTLYGYSPRMRYDLVFNSFVKDAFTKKTLTVDAGGEIWRPMIDIEDATNTYIRCLELEDKYIGSKIFNISSENWKIGTLAKEIKKILKKEKKIDIKLDIKPLSLTRNYKMDNTKFLKTFNFKNQRTIKDALLEIWKYLESDQNGQNSSNPIYYNDQWYTEFFKTKEGKKFQSYFNSYEFGF